MSLPITSTPTYNLTVPTTKQKIKFRPYYVKEEKVLYVALESGEPQQIADALANIVTECVVTPGFSLDNLSIADIEYIFINIRGESVDNIVPVTVYAPDDEETEVSFKIDISKIKVSFTKEHTNKIQLSDNLWVEMKYPKLQDYVDVGSTIEDTFKLMSKCIVKLYDEENIWDSNTTTEEEFLDFVERLTSVQFKKMKQFFDTMPTMKHVIKLKNPKTGFEFDYTVQGITDFFV